MYSVLQLLHVVRVCACVSVSICVQCSDYLWTEVVSKSVCSGCDDLYLLDFSEGKEGASDNPLCCLDHSVVSLSASVQLENHTVMQ